MRQSLASQALLACISYERIAKDLSSIRSSIIMHPCPEQSQPEPDCGYDGHPSCIQEYDYRVDGEPIPELCDNCQIVKEVRERRTQLKKDMQKVRRQIRMIAKRSLEVA